MVWKKFQLNQMKLWSGFSTKIQNKIIGDQQNNINFHEDDLSDVVESRTFCLYEDIEKIKKLGLGQGGSLENAVVVGKEKF